MGHTSSETLLARAVVGRGLLDRASRGESPDLVGGARQGPVDVSQHGWSDLDVVGSNLSEGMGWRQESGTSCCSEREGSGAKNSAIGRDTRDVTGDH